MINKINENEMINVHLSDFIKENGSEVLIDESLYIDGTLDKSLIANIKVDDFYNGLKKYPTPPSVDNLVVVKGRGENRFDLYIIELKDVKKMAGLDTKNIEHKFKTTILDFMSDKFKDIFLCEESLVCNVNAWVVCNRFRGYLGDHADDERYRERIRNTAMERLLLTKPFRFRNKAIPLQLKVNDTCHIN